MRIVADVAEYLVQGARELIEGGRYQDLSSFVAASMENQLTLEGTPFGTGAQSSVRAPARVKPSGEPSMLPLRGLELPAKEVPTLESRSRPGDTPVEQWLWGYINRVLPVKVAVRLLANRLGPARSLVPLHLFKAEAAETARVLGLRLMSNDDEHGRRRGERLSEGLPVAEDEDASLSRYASNFVGYERKRDGVFFGGLFELKLGDAGEVRGELGVGLTEAGLCFAQIANPILDNWDTSSSLSEEEIEFYLSHIRASVPGEAFAIELILTLMSEGVDTRGKLSEQVTKRLELEWTDTVASIQVAGATARMSELGLVDRMRDGQGVVYRISERGSSWLLEQ